MNIADLDHKTMESIVRRVQYQVGVSKEDAEDALSSAIVSVLNKPEMYEYVEHMENMLVNMAIKDAINAMNKGTSVGILVDKERYTGGDMDAELERRETLIRTLCYDLSPGEREVAMRVLLGMETKDIAQELNLSVWTVYTINERIHKKVSSL